ncbi:MAG: hypothetical protein HYV04_12505 [Deltaproteobacteria bacterium]|nr:hypothetical protein [Deltaproteobacteria bacterium]
MSTNMCGRFTYANEFRDIRIRFKDAGQVLSLLKSFPPELMEAYDVSTLVNSPRNDLAECIRPEG